MKNNHFPLCPHCGKENNWKPSEMKLINRRCDHCRERVTLYTKRFWFIEPYKGEIYKRKKARELAAAEKRLSKK
jgi:hypothetical protein